MDWQLSVAGGQSLILYAQSRDLQTCNQFVGEVASRLLGEPPHWLLNVVPSYASLLVDFDPLLTDVYAVRAHLSALAGECHRHDKGQDITPTSVTRHVLPVCYELPEDNDMARVEDKTGLTRSDIIALHQQTEYRVFAVGFAPGFGFLGELDPRLAVERLPTPRRLVPAGAVAITGRQTAVYPLSSPGGWNIIGRCPLPLFNPSTAETRLRVGDRVRFSAIDAAEYTHQVAAGK